MMLPLKSDANVFRPVFYKKKSASLLFFFDVTVNLN